MQLTEYYRSYDLPWEIDPRINAAARLLSADWCCCCCSR